VRFLKEYGHIASLFPGHLTLMEKKRMVYSIEDSLKAPKYRIILTLPVINSAYSVAFVAFGQSKSSVEPDDCKREQYIDYNSFIGNTDAWPRAEGY
jgi:6-phosphogluconolactonase